MTKSLKATKQTTSPEQNSEEIGRRLLDWYDRHGRDLPWRDEPTPYAVWVSEIMSQQTRIAAMLPYFARWMAAFPCISALAGAEEEAVLKAWEGLGYYSRARNLQRAARVLMDDYRGEMPSSSAELAKLPGIGPYTAAAIASIAFGERVAAVDGNALRVISRVFAVTLDVGSREARECIGLLLYGILPAERPGDGNQAVMDLGSSHCLPKQPHCAGCPLETCCAARAGGWERQLPVKTAKKAQRVEYRAVALITDEKDRYLLHKREERLLHGLWEFPGERLTEPEARPLWGALMKMGLKIEFCEKGPEASHLFTHIHWKMRGYWLSAQSIDLPPEYTWANADELNAYPIPSAMAVFLRAVLAKERLDACNGQMSLL